MAREVRIDAEDSVLDAFEIEKPYGVSFWDALVVQTAASGAEVLYSEDLSNGRIHGGVSVVPRIAFGG